MKFIVAVEYLQGVAVFYEFFPIENKPFIRERFYQHSPIEAPSVEVAAEQFFKGRMTPRHTARLLERKEKSTTFVLDYDNTIRDALKS
jgi:hypothetical protein